MDAIGITFGIGIASAMIAISAYFAWRQRLILHSLQFDNKASLEHRRYLVKQSWRRIFGSLVLLVLAGMLIGSLFLNYDPQQMSRDELRYVTVYTMTMLLLVLVILALAVFDFWATARHGVQQQKQLFREHQEMLEAELEEHRQRRQTEMN
ncbi:MAG: hypothetical protein HY289_15050 [Planctomycetes bacterium]|nr:hypothetical protein [Planctomycetota bacterium]